ncbi:ribosomal protein S18-alanine N-acetyltransferase [Desulfolucanica intricata]|uniref:ribosomal protein S18-alanine N-acetyltransferase n=1 Tax=Desulfolucanica intricata TaxID=1285191 RepID=UPI00082C3A76|nr:ribosomal protein S18-alanine N-acetyltransferase [Desulfolucanica intricata]
MKLEFEKMKVEHLDQVTEIEKKCFLTPWSRYAFTYEILQNDFAHYIVALVDNQVVGYAGMWVVIDEAHITNVAVHPNYRGKQIGESLMKQMFIRAALRGAAKMTLEVRRSNEPAKRLYTQMGFKEYGVRKGYYSDTNEDAIIMWKDELLKIGKTRNNVNS